MRPFTKVFVKQIQGILYYFPESIWQFQGSSKFPLEHSLISISFRGTQMCLGTFKVDQSSWIFIYESLGLIYESLGLFYKNFRKNGVFFTKVFVKKDPTFVNKTAKNHTFFPLAPHRML